MIIMIYISLKKIETIHHELPLLPSSSSPITPKPFTTLSSFTLISYNEISSLLSKDLLKWSHFSLSPLSFPLSRLSLISPSYWLLHYCLQTCPRLIFRKLSFDLSIPDSYCLISLFPFVGKFLAKSIYNWCSHFLSFLTPASSFN